MSTDNDVASRNRREVDDLVHDHLPLVGYAVRETMARVPGHVHRDDLASAGMYALVLAARKYDAGQGVPFARYASTRIRGAMVDELRGMDWASRSVRRRAREIHDVRNRLASELGRTATDAEVARILGVGVEELASNQQDLSRAVIGSLSEIDGGGEEALLPSGGPTPHELVEHRERVAYLQDAVARLPERLRTVVEGYFLAERPMAEIAEELGVSQSRVSQMRAEALVLLRDALNSALDPDLVPARRSPNGAAAQRRNAYFAEVAAHRTYAARISGDREPARTA